MADWAFHIVDVFADRPLAGNQLAVFADAADIPDAVLQPLARETGRPSELLARVLGSEDRVEAIEVGGYGVPVGGGWFNADLLRDTYGT